MNYLHAILLCFLGVAFSSVAQQTDVLYDEPFDASILEDEKDPARLERFAKMGLVNTAVPETLDQLRVQKVTPSPSAEDGKEKKSEHSEIPKQVKTEQPTKPQGGPTGSSTNGRDTLRHSDTRFQREMVTQMNDERVRHPGYSDQLGADPSKRMVQSRSPRARKIARNTARIPIPHRKQSGFQESAQPQRDSTRGLPDNRIRAEHVRGSSMVGQKRTVRQTVGANQSRRPPARAINVKPNAEMMPNSRMGLNRSNRRYRTGGADQIPRGRLVLRGTVRVHRSAQLELGMLGRGIADKNGTGWAKVRDGTESGNGPVSGAVAANGVIQTESVSGEFLASEKVQMTGGAKTERRESVGLLGKSPRKRFMRH